jgi:hypothetical protein
VATRAGDRRKMLGNIKRAHLTFFAGLNTARRVTPSGTGHVKGSAKGDQWAVSLLPWDKQPAAAIPVR